MGGANRKQSYFDHQVLYPSSAPFLYSTSCSGSTSIPTSSSSKNETWLPVVQCPVPSTLDTFFDAGADHLALHPERASCNILRADILVDEEVKPAVFKKESKGRADGETRSSEPEGKGQDQQTILEFTGYELFRRIRRRLLPTRPMDSNLEQECLFYREVAASEDGPEDPNASTHSEAGGMIVLLPDFRSLMKKSENGILEEPEVPFYHPKVHGIAWRYLPQESSVEEGAQRAVLGTLRVDILPFASSATNTDANAEEEGEKNDHDSKKSPSLPPDSKLFRTCLHLVVKLHQVLPSPEDPPYVKRNIHDLLVRREEFQDRYRSIKAKYTWLLEQDLWKKIVGTDQNKHIWEDVAIATWLIYLQGTDRYTHKSTKFIDVGCGNGMLVHVLTEEKCNVVGVDLRQRKSWTMMFPAEVTARLHVDTLDPLAILSSLRGEASSEESTSGVPKAWEWTPKMDGQEPSFSPFLIGNHADELTPWIPLFAAMTPLQQNENAKVNEVVESGIPFTVIPCCFWSFTEKFGMGRYNKITVDDLSFWESVLSPSARRRLLKAKPQSLPGVPAAERTPHPFLVPFFAPTPPLWIAEREKKSIGRYASYQLFVAHITLMCGYLPEREAMRIPSTKNCAIVGRTRIWDWEGPEGDTDDDGLEEVETPEAKRERVLRGRGKVFEYVNEIVEQTRGKWKPRSAGKGPHG